jgi:ribonuclease T1
MKYEDLTACRPEVGQTLRGIISGNFPYSKDDTTFQNRERILPAVSGSQSYREYTVRTPGESDRGARRIVTSGAESRRSANYTTLYYTDDHYDSFWIVEKPAS